MNIYTANYDANKPTLKSVEVPLNSNFGIAVGVKYNGEDVKLKQNDILLDGELSPSDMIDDKYAVFKLSSDGEAGYDKHTISSTIDGMTVVEKSFKHVLTQEEASARPFVVKCDTLNGLTIAPPMSDTTGKSPIYTDRGPHGWPLLLLAVNNGEDVYSGKPTYMYGIGDDGNIDYNKPIAFIQGGSAGFGEYIYELKVPNETYTNWVYGNEFTVPENGMYISINNPSSAMYRTDLHFDYTYTERISCQFDLNIKKEDQGIIEGYGDEYIFKNTVNLSGTYADDTEFSFTVPVVEEPDSSDSELIDG